MLHPKHLSAQLSRVVWHCCLTTVRVVTLFDLRSEVIQDIVCTKYTEVGQLSDLEELANIVGLDLDGPNEKGAAAAMIKEDLDSDLTLAQK